MQKNHGTKGSATPWLHPEERVWELSRGALLLPEMLLLLPPPATTTVQSAARANRPATTPSCRGSHAELQRQCRRLLASTSGLFSTTSTRDELSVFLNPEALIPPVLYVSYSELLSE